MYSCCNNISLFGSGHVNNFKNRGRHSIVCIHTCTDEVLTNAEIKEIVNCNEDVMLVWASKCRKVI